jgi:uncharacterized membrane protein YqjE
MTIGERPRRREGVVALARRLVSSGVTLARLEIQSGRQEVGESLGSNARAALFFGIAAFFGLLAIIALVGLIIALLAFVLPTWASALVVLVTFIVLGLLFALAGRRRIRNPVPQETIASVKEDLAWARRLLRRE